MEIIRDHWMPDAVVAFCSNPKCSLKFTTLRRKHHCRCCGNVFCRSCCCRFMPLCPWTAQVDQNGVRAKVCLLCYARGVEEGITFENGSRSSVSSSDTDSGVLPPESLGDLSQKPIMPASPTGHPFPYNPDLVQHDSSSDALTNPVWRDPSSAGSTYDEVTMERGDDCLPGFLEGEVIDDCAKDADTDRLTYGTEAEAQWASDFVRETEPELRSERPEAEWREASLEESIFRRQPTLCTRQEDDESLSASQQDDVGSERDADNGVCKESLEEVIFSKRPSFKRPPPVMRSVSMRESSSMSRSVSTLRSTSMNDRLLSRGSLMREYPVLRIGPIPECAPSYREVEEGIDLLAVRQPWGDGGVAAVDKKAAALQWQVDDVCRWLEETVPFPASRGLEYAHVFQLAGIDGLGLLTMQRSHKACKNMTDLDWQTFKTARRQLLVGPGGHISSSPREDTTGRAWNFRDPVLKSGFGMMTGSGLGRMPHQQPSRSDVVQGQTSGLTSSGGSGGSSSVSWLWNLVGGRKEKMLEEKLEAVTKEVQELRGELTCSEEREATLQAVLEHLDDVLKSSHLAEYIYTRSKWVLSGETSVDEENEEEEDDGGEWLQRFVVLHEDTISYYMLATDLHPQGTIPLAQVIEASVITEKELNIGEAGWFGFQVTTCDQLRLECATKNDCKVETWLTAIEEKRSSLRYVDPLLGKLERRNSDSGSLYSSSTSFVW